MEWRGNVSRLHIFIKDVIPKSPGFNFPRPAWVKVNCIRTGVGLFLSETHKWGMVSTAACECGTEEQTAEHVTTFCLIYHHPNVARVFSDVDKNLATWLMETCPGNLVDRPAPVHLPQTKKKNKKAKCITNLNSKQSILIVQKIDLELNCLLNISLNTKHNSYYKSTQKND